MLNTILVLRSFERHCCSKPFISLHLTLTVLVPWKPDGLACKRELTINFVIDQDSFLPYLLFCNCTAFTEGT